MPIRPPRGKGATGGRSLPEFDDDGRRAELLAVAPEDSRNSLADHVDRLVRPPHPEPPRGVGRAGAAPFVGEIDLDREDGAGRRVPDGRDREVLEETARVRARRGPLAP